MATASLIRTDRLPASILAMVVGYIGSISLSDNSFGHLGL